MRIPIPKYIYNYFVDGYTIFFFKYCFNITIFINNIIVKYRNCINTIPIFVYSNINKIIIYVCLGIRITRVFTN